MLGGERKVIVAIDAGHGGKDPGSHGPGGTLEKNVTLAVAKALAAQINRQPGMQAILTRDSDIFIPLERRYQIARENNADMFVSIHADAYSSEDARGSSVWVLSSRGKTGTDYVLIARAGTGERPYAELLADLEGALRQLSRRPSHNDARGGED